MKNRVFRWAPRRFPTLLTGDTPSRSSLADLRACLGPDFARVIPSLPPPLQLVLLPSPPDS
jgi:hypothetical protein